MRKALSFVTALVFGSLVLLPAAHAQGLDMVLADFTCVGDEYAIKFGVINKYTYNAHLVLGFKILVDGKPGGCKQLTLDAPAGSDGSSLQTTNIAGPCSTGQATLEAKLFYGNDLDRVGPWLSDCPQRP